MSYPAPPLICIPCIYVESLKEEVRKRVSLSLRLKRERKKEEARKKYLRECIFLKKIEFFFFKKEEVKYQRIKNGS